MYLSKADIINYCEIFPISGASQKIWLNKPNFSAIIKFNDNQYANSYCDVFYTQLSQKLGFDCIDSKFCRTELNFSEIDYTLRSKHSFYKDVFPTYNYYLTATPFKEQLFSYEGSISNDFNPNEKLSFIDLETIENFFCKKRLFMFKHTFTEELNINNLKKALNNIKKYCELNNLNVNLNDIYIELCKRSIIDWLVFQNDRVSWNVAFLIDEETRSLKLAPCFDNSYALPFCYSFDEILIKDKELAKLFKYKSFKVKNFNHKIKFNHSPMNWPMYQMSDDYETLKNIINKYKKIPELHYFINSLIKIDLKKILIELNNEAIKNSCSPIRKGQFNAIVSAITYKQNVLKNFLKADLIKHKKNFSTKILFNFLENTLN